MREKKKIKFDKMQEFFINKDSINPVLEMELIYDGRYDFEKSLINDALQDSIITFSMYADFRGLVSGRTSWA